MEIQSLGFATWLELYKYIQEANLHNEPRVALIWPEDFKLDPAIVENADPHTVVMEGREVTVDMQWVKSNAFLELYEALPSRAAVDVIEAMVKGAAAIAGKQYSGPVIEFLNKIPTRP